MRRFINVKRTVATLLATIMLVGVTACGSDTSDNREVTSTSTTSTVTSAGTEAIVAKRTIAVEETVGTVTADDGSEKINPVKGENLKSGQKVTTEAESSLTLLLDADKHVYAGESTIFQLTAEGGEKSTKTVLALEVGELRSVIDNKLGADESYEVTTSNSTMSVRGTDFTVIVKLVNGKTVTIVRVDEGIVNIKTIGGEETGIDAEPGTSYEISETGIKELKEEAKSRQLKETYTAYTNGTPDYTYTQVYIYDNYGYLVKVEYNNSNGVTYWYEYENDEDGVPVKESLVYPSGVAYYTNFEYDQQGYKARETVIDPNGGVDTMIQETLYTYDVDGNLIDEKRPIDEWDAFTYWSSYSYDANGNMTEKVYHSNLEDATVSQRFTWVYDDQERLTSYVVNSYWDGQTYNDEEWKDIKYDDNGNMSEYVQYLSDSPFYKFVLTYDEKGNVLTETVCDPFISGLIYGITEHEYANDGE